MGMSVCMSVRSQTWHKSGTSTITCGVIYRQIGGAEQLCNWSRPSVRLCFGSNLGSGAKNRSNFQMDTSPEFFAFQILAPFLSPHFWQNATKLISLAFA